MIQMQRRQSHHDGEYRWMLDTGVPRFTADGSFAGYIGSCIDVTDRHVAQETVHASETKFRALFESNLLPIIYWNEAGTIVDSNEAFLQLTGFTNEEVKAGKLQADPLISEDRSASKKAREDWHVTQKRLMQFEKQFVLRDGRHIPVLVTASLSGRKDSGMAFLMLVVLTMELHGFYPAAAQAADKLDRTVLPISEPKHSAITTFDARNATPPPRFEVEAPANSPNVLIVLIDDMGFGQSSSFGGPIHMCCPRSGFATRGPGAMAVASRSFGL